MKFNIDGLSTEKVKELQEKYGKNEIVKGKKESFFAKIIHIICEPMFLLLIIAAVIYFILGEPRDGMVMLVFVLGIISIDIIQEWKTDKTLNALKDLSAPKINVIRDGIKQEINSEDLVPRDLMLIHEGVKIPADGYVVKCSGLAIDESSLTGEAEPVWKVIYKGEEVEDYWRADYCYAGTLVIQGTGSIVVDKIGSKTEYGKIGKNVINTVSEDTPLQKQTSRLVKKCAIIALILFLIVGILTYFNIPDHSLKDRVIESILSGITLAMAMIPEEFPVILTVFLSMGAWRLAKKSSLVKKLPSVETLGAVSILCVDKTGTITMNEMKVDNIWTKDSSDHDLCRYMGMCCEEETYDPMEKAMLKKCLEFGFDENSLFNGEKIKEYPFSNNSKMMGHIWKIDKDIILVAKGSPESILEICDLTKKEKEMVSQEILNMSKQGLRVIAIANKKIDDEILDDLNSYRLKLNGLVGLIDPPRKSVKKDIALCNKAGIRVVMITGDNGITASSIAKKIGMQNSDSIITGTMIDEMSDEELCLKVKDVSIFSRVIPEHMMRIVKAFKKNGEIVAMTGDGVNDAPALKYADIGIAMGKRGSEVSREAADLILMDDNFTTIVDTVKDGRRIYDNIRKAVEYIFVIHIPIALSSLFAPLLGISPSNLLLLPLHVVLLELVIDPTCSIILERQPAERNIMERYPRDKDDKILNRKGLLKSTIQGLVIFITAFSTYYYMLESSASVARTMGLVIIILSNLLLVQVNSSSTDYAFTSIKRLIKDKVMWLANIVTILGIAIIVYSPINSFLRLSSLTIRQLFITIILSFISVFWYEIVKFVKKNKWV